MGLRVVSLETDYEYMKFVSNLCPPNVLFILWNNREIYIEGLFGLSLVDGIAPRITQFNIASKHSNIIAVDDYEEEDIKSHLISKIVSYDRIDEQTTTLAIFRGKNV
jgi:hypothetical protein